MMQSTHSNASQTSNTMSNNNQNPDEKVLQDLSALTEQITLCQSMLLNAGGPSSIDANEALLTVIGFLEACVPRMVELIEAAAQGALMAETFEECLMVNDKLTNVLADVDKDPKDRKPLTPAAASVGDSKSNGDSTTAQNTDVIDEGMKQLSVVGGGKTTGLDSEDASKPPAVEDPFASGLDLLAPTPPTHAFKITESMGSSLGSAESAEANGAKAADDDDFDAFFKDRTAAP